METDIFMFVALWQLTTAYNYIQQRPDDSVYRLPQNNYEKYINFENFDDTNRRGRQISSGGFRWDSPSDNFANERSRINWDSQNEEFRDTFVFEDDFENRDFVPRTTQRSNQIPPNRRKRPTTERVPSSTVAIPGMGTPRTPCEDKCLSTPQYNPVCGDDDMTYFNRFRLNCAQKCGKRVKLKHFGACSLIPPRG